MAGRRPARRGARDREHDGRRGGAGPLGECLGLAIKKLRVDARLTQSELARRAKISKSFLAACETGVGTPSLETLERILGALGRSYEDLTRAQARCVRGGGAIRRARVRGGGGGGRRPGKAPHLVARLGLALRVVRRQRDLTQDELATRAGVSKQVIGAWETGRAVPAVAFLDKVAAALEITWAELEVAARASPLEGKRRVKRSRRREETPIAGAGGRHAERVALETAEGWRRAFNRLHGDLREGAGSSGEPGLSADGDVSRLGWLLTSPTHLGKALEWLREERGLSRSELASESGVRVSQVWSYEKGSNSPQLSRLVRLVTALESSWDGLVAAGWVVFGRPEAVAAGGWVELARSRSQAGIQVEETVSRLASRRKALRWSYCKAGRRSGLYQVTVQRLEKGVLDPRSVTVGKLMTGLRIDAAGLAGRRSGGEEPEAELDSERAVVVQPDGSFMMALLADRIGRRWEAAGREEGTSGEELDAVP